MELHYVEVENWDKLYDNDHIIFKLPKKQIEYEIVILNGVFCWAINADINSEIFDYLNLDATDFVQNIVKYPCTGVWPKVKSIDDLKKVIKALDYECVKMFGECNTPKFKVGDKVRILPRNSDIFYTPMYTDGMTQYAGQIDTVSEIHDKTGSISLERISDYYWNPKALELVNEKEESKAMNVNQAKDGDYLSITNNNGNKYIVIFRNIKDKEVIRYATYDSDANALYFDAQKNYGYWGNLSGISKVNYATEEEKQLLDSELREAGYSWNNSTKKLEAIDSPNTLINRDKPETQFEAEVNLFPTKKHYQLNFNY